MAAGVFRPPRITFLNQRQMNRQANRQVRQSIKAQQAPILTAQAAADARAVAAQKAIAGFGTAAAGILQQSAGQIPAVYQQEAQAQAGLAAGYSQQAGDAVRSQVAQSQALIDRLAPGGQETAPNVQGTQDAMYAQGGYIPGASLEEQAAAANRYGLEQPAIQVARTGQDIQQAQQQQVQDDQQYTDQMMALAAQEPQLRTQIMQQLQQNEMAKRSAYIQQQAQNMVNQRFQVTAGQAQERINVSRQLGQANLRLRQAANNLAVKKFLQQGGTIDSAASHAAGYLIAHDGHTILGKNGKPIPVKSYSGGSGGASGVGSTKYGEAVRSVDSLLPTPNANPHYNALITDPLQAMSYKYIARPGKGTMVKGISPGGASYNAGWYTNKVSEAATTATRAGVNTFADGVKYLMNSYGLSRPAARKALIAGGWKPTGQRPRK